MSESELTSKIEEIDSTLKEVRKRLSLLKKQVTEEETILITLNISRERLVEQRRLFMKEHYNPEITERENDIERFKKVLPELIKKI